MSTCVLTTLWVPYAASKHPHAPHASPCASMQIFMSVVDREFPQPGSADQYMDELKTHLKSATAELKLHVSGVSFFMETEISGLRQQSATIRGRGGGLIKACG